MLVWTIIILSLCILGHAQVPGTSKANNPLNLPIKINGTTLATTATIDANWRWVHINGGYTNCFDGGWISPYCTDPIQCVKNCQLEGVPTSDYTNVYGATVSGNALTLKYVTGSNVGSRFYLLAPDGKQYQPFNLLNREFTFTVDVSTLPCGVNGALYFVDIPLDGGLNSLNKAGAPFGTGYGDAQGPLDLKYVNGFANTNSTGNFAIEMDIWEANAYATQLTAHACSITRTQKCTSAIECGQNSYCDKSGADYNPYRVGNTSLYGPHLTVDTTQPITVITQFITDSGTDTGNLIKIQRYYKQGGIITNGGFITATSAEYYKNLFQDNSRLPELGGLHAIGDAFKRGMTLVLSLWDDTAVSMLWLDSVYPVGSTATGAKRGPCPTTTGIPSTTRTKYGATAKVVYSDIQVNPIGTFSSGLSPTPSPTPVPTPIPTPVPTPIPTPVPTPPPVPSTSCVAQYGQCGGLNWSGSTTCCAPSTCVVTNPWYSQCLSSTPSPPPVTPSPTPSPVPPTPKPPTPPPVTPTPTPPPVTPTPTPTNCSQMYTCTCAC